MIKIIQQKRNELLHRDEISALKEDVKTPQINEIKTEIAAVLKKDAGLVAIKRIKGRFGQKKFLVEAYAYDNQDIINKIEPKAKGKKEEKKEEASQKTEQIKEEQSKQSN